MTQRIDDHDVYMEENEVNDGTPLYAYNVKSYTSYTTGPASPAREVYSFMSSSMVSPISTSPAVHAGSTTRLRASADALASALV